MKKRILPRFFVIVFFMIFKAFQMILELVK